MTKLNQVISKDRVREYGEVFTAPREVKAMCDLVGPALNRIHTTIDYIENNITGGVDYARN